MWSQWTLRHTVYMTVTTALAGLCNVQSYKLPNGGEIKAVLLSGANQWKNYAMQSDLCHAYQVLHANGIPDDNIIVMMYDDIAFNELNPNQGVIISRPHGPNVYKNIKKDYVGKDVNKHVFFNVLRGNKTAVKGIGSGKVLESGPKDHVFIFHAGHGHPGLLKMPDDNDIMYYELIDELQKMAKSSRFAKMFYYIAACYSGSMVQNLTDDLNIFVMTSSLPNETTSSCQYYPKPISLGGEFDFFWLRDAETVDLRRETVLTQFKKVHKQTTLSHPQVYGDFTLGSTRTSEVLGFSEHPVPSYGDDECGDPVPEHQVPVVALEYRIRAAKDPKERKRHEMKLEELQQSREDMVQFFSKLAEEVLTPDKMRLYPETLSKTHADIKDTNIVCYENAVKYFNDNCFKLSNDPFVGTQLHILINLCDLVPEARLVEAMLSVCRKYPVHRVVL